VLVLRARARRTRCNWSAAGARRTRCLRSAAVARRAVRLSGAAQHRQQAAREGEPPKASTDSAHGSECVQAVRQGGAGLCGGFRAESWVKASPPRAARLSLAQPVTSSVSPQGHDRRWSSHIPSAGEYQSEQLPAVQRSASGAGCMLRHRAGAGLRDERGRPRWGDAHLGASPRRPRESARGCDSIGRSTLWGGRYVEGEGWLSLTRPLRLPSLPRLLTLSCPSVSRAQRGAARACPPRARSGARAMNLGLQDKDRTEAHRAAIFDRFSGFRPRAFRCPTDIRARGRCRGPGSCPTAATPLRDRGRWRLRFAPR